MWIHYWFGQHQEAIEINIFIKTVDSGSCEPSLVAVFLHYQIWYRMIGRHSVTRYVISIDHTGSKLQNNDKTFSKRFWKFSKKQMTNIYIYCDKTIVLTTIPNQKNTDYTQCWVTFCLCKHMLFSSYRVQIVKMKLLNIATKSSCSVNLLLWNFTYVKFQHSRNSWFSKS